MDSGPLVGVGHHNTEGLKKSLVSPASPSASDLGGPRHLAVLRPRGSKTRSERDRERKRQRDRYFARERRPRPMKKGPLILDRSKRNRSGERWLLVAFERVLPRFRLSMAFSARGCSWDVLRSYRREWPWKPCGKVCWLSERNGANLK